jgi:hypothetical protein
LKQPILFGTELQLKNQVKYPEVTLDEILNWNSHTDHRMQKASIVFWKCRRAIGEMTPKVVYWIYTPICLTVLKKGITKFINRTLKTPCLCKDNRQHAFYSKGHITLKVIPDAAMVFILRESQDRRLTD